MTTTLRLIPPMLAVLAGFACLFGVYPLITGAVAFVAAIQTVRLLRKDA